jgi:hypothetical protein
MNNRCCIEHTPDNTVMPPLRTRRPRHAAFYGTALMALGLSALLAACDRTEPQPPLAVGNTTATEAKPPVPVAGKDASVPDAKGAVSASSSNTESTQMPLPGQANDHSLPNSGQRAGQGDAPPVSASAPAGK